MVISTTDESVEIWQNPEDAEDIATVGDLFDGFALKSAVLKFMAGSEDGLHPHRILEDFHEECEALGITPSPCPMCGRYSDHSHGM